MATEVDICNMALDAIRAPRIGDLSEKSVSAKQCSLHYPEVRDGMLDDEWSFSTKIAPLVTSFLEVTGWRYTYVLPSDCIRLTRAFVPDPTLDLPDGTVFRPEYRASQEVFERAVLYQVLRQDDEKVLVSNTSGLYARYRSRLTQAGDFPVWFRRALAYLLAAEIAVPILGHTLGVQMKNGLLSMYQAYLARAVSADGNEQKISTEYADEGAYNNLDYSNWRG